MSTEIFQIVMSKLHFARKFFRKKFSDKNIEEHNIEQLSAKLLFDLTRNTGFEVSKGTLGECWIKSCCEWGNRQEDDICGLDHNRLAVFDKMKRIYDGSSLKLQFPKVGLKRCNVDYY